MSYCLKLNYVELSHHLAIILESTLKEPEARVRTCMHLHVSIAMTAA